ncbi:Cof-type HAD-IIB family hydrolase [Konateibacter massiliensis]|uniref:Cof-type HAD-IIB family hydrolase n=1 Tax=Konateibacter massiliensis TaxID=2002841 RepID=UPI000C15C0F4|nr:Cof-type HAD-IIB family hydrolase [Konateibacter massiliensis]
MNATKILFTDLDGTLLNDERKISYQNKQAIQKALDMGHKIVITTGRPLASTLLLTEELGLDGDGCYAITFNGGLIYDCGAKQAISKATLSKEYLGTLFDAARRHQVHYHSYSDKNVVSEHLTDELTRYCDHIKIPYQVVEKIEEALTENPIKAIMINFEGRDRLSKIKQELEAFCQDKINCYFSSPYLLEFGSLDASKGNALKFLCNHLGVPVENSIAAGDEENDISMLQAAGIGAVMANASDEIKRYADYVTENNNNNHGIAEIIEKFLL